MRIVFYDIKVLRKGDSGAKDTQMIVPNIPDFMIPVYEFIYGKEHVEPYRRVKRTKELILNNTNAFKTRLAVFIPENRVSTFVKTYGMDFQIFYNEFRSRKLAEFERVCKEINDSLKHLP